MSWDGHTHTTEDAGVETSPHAHLVTTQSIPRAEGAEVNLYISVRPYSKLHCSSQKDIDVARRPMFLAIRYKLSVLNGDLHPPKFVTYWNCAIVQDPYT